MIFSGRNFGPVRYVWRPAGRKLWPGFSEHVKKTNDNTLIDLEDGHWLNPVTLTTISPHRVGSAANALNGCRKGQQHATFLQLVGCFVQPTIVNFE